MTTRQPSNDSAPLPARSPRPAWHRRLTATWRDLPDHLVLGAMKAGTTQLDRLLAANPGVDERTWKESRYLTEPNPTRLGYRARYELTLRRRRRERRVGHALRVGDASPYDLFHPRAARVAARLVPDARFVILLRDPVDRAWSHHRHARRLGLETLDFDEAIAAEEARLEGEEARLVANEDALSGPHQHWSYLARGRYEPQLERWFHAFPRDRFLILFSEAFFADPAGTMRRVEAHLGLPETPEVPGRPVANRGDGSTVPPETRSRLRVRLADADLALERLLGVAPPWR